MDRLFASSPSQNQPAEPAPMVPRPIGLALASSPDCLGSGALLLKDLTPVRPCLSSVTLSKYLQVDTQSVACVDLPPIPGSTESLLSSARRNHTGAQGPDFVGPASLASKSGPGILGREPGRKILNLFQIRNQLQEESTSLTWTPTCQSEFVFQKEKGNCPEGSRGERKIPAGDGTVSAWVHMSAHTCLCQDCG